ncbi:hypothetical protein KY343_04130 [Candidatus Woesearchaeota archaeon]|nr:hypothetical protein [Candidatus Woesearchaeota archaeon]
MDGDNLYNGHDELTGLHDSFYFSTELERDIAELKRSGKSNHLTVLTLDSDTPVEIFKEIAEWWKDQFIRVCRYEKASDYMLMGLDEDEGALKRIKSLFDELNGKYPDLKVVRVETIKIDGNSGSLDELVGSIPE